MSAHGKEDGKSSTLTVVKAVSFYIVSSIAMVLANKAVLNVIDLPLLFLWLQLVFAVVLLHILALSTSWYTIPTLSWSTCRALVPLISINVLGLMLNTYCLKYVDASFYQVARAMVLPLTVFFSYQFLGQRTSGSILFACGIVCSGFLTGVFLDNAQSQPLIPTGNFVGVFFGFFSSVTTAIHSVVIKSSIKAVSDRTLDLVYYNNLLSAIVLLPIVMISGEAANVYILLTDDAEWAERGTVVFNALSLGVVVTGLFGLLINLAGFFQIQVTSPTTHMISSAVRGVLQTFLAAMLLSELIGASRIIGILLTITGSALYTYLKANAAPVKSAPLLPLTTSTTDHKA